MPLASAYAKSFPRNSQTRRVTSEMLITTGTNTPETLSATFAIGAFVACRIADHLDDLGQGSVLTHAGSLAAEEARLIGGSGADPVACGLVHRDALAGQALSFTALTPSSTTPSTGMFSPGRTTKMSPFCTSAMETVTSAPFRTSVAVLGASFIRLLRRRWSCPWSVLPASCPP